MIQNMPELVTNRGDIDRVFRFAMADIACNIHPYSAGLVVGEPVLGAGFDYFDPWTRDTAINIYNGASLLYPEVTRNNLLATLTRSGETTVLRDIPGSPEGNNNYWDAIIWVLGVWHYYVYTGDRDFLETALPIITRAFEVFEDLEFDGEKGLFRGGSVYGDGIAAYPDTYAEPTWAHSDIGGWPERNPDRAYPRGTGLPMCSLSTNCVYVEAYRLAARIARELGSDSSESWETKADELRDAINRHFWMEEEGTYRYLVDPFGGCDHQEGLGISFAVLFGIADEEKTARVMENAQITEYGIACVWPSFERYRTGERVFGRHCGTVWPFIQGFWAEAALAGRRKDLFDSEFFTLTWLAFHSDGFYELYHPITGEPYGGVQEGIRWSEWPSIPRQTWSATGYLHMVLAGMFGMRFSPEGVSFRPSLPEGVTTARLRKFPYRGMMLEISLEGSGNSVRSLLVNDQPGDFIPADAQGTQKVTIVLGDE